MRSQKTIINSAIFLVGDHNKVHLLCLLACLVLLCFTLTVRAEQKNDSGSSNPTSEGFVDQRTKIYFYNPEVNAARNLVLKNTWDTYLADRGPYEFQPVDNSESFKQLLKNQDHAAFIMAEWFYSSIIDSQIADLDFAFQGRKHKQDTYRKILISNKSIFDFEKVTIASSGSVARARDILQSIYPELSSSQLNNLNILVVPKDIDALMAVGYGLAEMALATEVGLSKMARLNQTMFNDMAILKESKPFKRSVLVFKSTDVVLKINLARALAAMPMSLEGQEALSLLGLDEWQATQQLSADVLQGLSDRNTEVEQEQGGQHDQ